MLKVKGKSQSYNIHELQGGKMMGPIHSQPPFFGVQGEGKKDEVMKSCELLNSINH
ncbi:hypothetical protein BVRB_1g009840 [Beta vulgaris subsp. vulgaris]|nr:hypothetical protein BVRB_1g009840 [Beta vulgaris subsp. vulgaris]